MPNQDGMGPVGKGPLTGRKGGSCILRLPDDPDEPVQGFAGKAGEPVSFSQNLQQSKEVSEMPLGDATGPKRVGPGKSKTRGFRTELDHLGIFGCFQGRGGGGHGRCNRLSNTGQSSSGGGARQGPRVTYSPESRMEGLKAQAQDMEKALNELKEKIKKEESRETERQQV